MPRFKNHEVWVECAGEPLEEFDVRLSGNMVSCWIPSQTGGVIRVRWKDYSDPWRISSKLFFFVDGVNVETMAVRAGHDRPDYDMIGIQTDAQTIRPLVFSEITWTDESTVKGVRPSTSDIGSIAVEIWQVKMIKRSGRHWSPQIPDVLNEASNENEEGTKAGRHRIGLSAETIKIDPRELSTAKPFDKRNPGPYIKFRFNYRPEDFLRAQGIIPPPPRIQYQTGSTGQKTIRAPEPSQDIPPQPRKCTRKRPAPKCRVKSEEDVKSTVLNTDSEDDSDSKELIRRLEYWQKELEEAQRRLAEVIDEMKGAEKASCRKKIKREPEAGVVVKREAGADANLICD
ncbi:hypothetical protein DFH11DRAFT_362850 [Phellopilus nigrolimitatus]|nr:hypothetical protein DFH11DRAFT_362850 [Phellopilus nigrolimitatus]